MVSLTSTPEKPSALDFFDRLSVRHIGPEVDFEPSPLLSEGY